MTQYHIYAMGNALVDIEIEATAAQLSELAVEKGVMTLVDQERQKFLSANLPGTHHSRACGGSAANTVIGAAKLGAKTYYSCKIAQDEVGDFYTQDLHNEGVSSNLDVQSRELGVTGQCLVFITPDVDRTMNTFLGISGELGEAEINFDALSQSQWLYIEGYLVSSPSAQEAAIMAKAHAESIGVKTAFSLSDPNMVRFFGDGIKTMIGKGVDLLFCNQEEALEFTKASSLEDASEQLKAVAKQFAITLGAKGALLFDGKNFINVEGFAVKAIDTNGAGDLFAGAFLFGISQGFDFAKAGKLASFASSRLVTQFGPRLTIEKMQEVKAFLKEL